VSCNNKPGNSEQSSKNQTRESVADSLEKEVIDGHDVAMPKSMKIPNLKKEAQRLIDSIGKLPAKAQVAAAPYKVRLENLLKNLDTAYNSMENWMEEFGKKMQEFNADSEKNDLEQKIKFLSEQKLKIGEVKETVLSSIAKADSLLKAIPPSRRD
jgi:DNA repair ATPase RecN